MPGDFAALDTSFPTTEGKTTEQKLDSMTDYLYQLLEQLRYILHNLGAENFSERSLDELTAPIRAALTDEVNGLRTRIDANAAGIQTEVTRAAAAEGDLSTRVTQTADAITAEATRAGSAEGSLSTRITANANGLSTKVEKSGVISAINQSAESVTISAGKVNLQGYVTASALAGSGTTTINGANITTGSISADRISGGSMDAGNITLYNSFTVMMEHGQYGDEDCGTIGGYMEGSGNAHGIRIRSSDTKKFITVTDSGLHLRAAQSGVGVNYIYIKPDEIVFSDDYRIDSDRRVKRDVDYDLARYADFFRALRPCRFRKVNGTSGRYHTGFIAQDVERALLDSGLTGADLAALVKSPGGPERGCAEYGLRYSELIALLTYMLQRLDARVAALESALGKASGSRSL